MSENYYLLDDMERYNPNFKRSEWENKSKEETIEEFKNIYQALGVDIDITTWIRLYDADKKYIYADDQGKQVCFVRDRIAPLFYKDNISYEEWENNHDNTVKVISSHRSKSVPLPVYNMKFDELGIEITMRNNFYNWMITIESIHELNINFMNLFDKAKKINPIYCEGMDTIGKVFGSFEDSKNKFTVEIQDDYNTYVFMYLLANHIKP